MRRLVLVITALALVAAGCADESAPAAERDSEVIEVFGNYRGADAEAFRLVLDQFEQATGHATSYVGTAAFADRIQERVDDRDPPDVALFPQPGLIRALATSGQIFTLESFGDEMAESVRANYPSILDSLSLDGELLAVPWRASVGSLVWYRPDEFERRGYWLPEDFFDFQALVSQMAFDGVVPWCIGIDAFAATGWVGTDWIEDIVLRTQPVDVYDAWSTGEIPFDDERIREAMRLWQELALLPGRHVGTTRTILNTPWERAGDPMFETEPGCQLHRQLGQYQTEIPDGRTIGPDGDVDIFVMPARQPGDSAPLLLAGEFAAALTPKAGVDELLTYLSDPRSGEIWAERGGYLAPHLGFDVDTYTNDFDRRLAGIMADAELIRFDGSDTMPPSVGVGSFWDGVVEFVATGDLDRSVATIDAGYGDAPVISCPLRGVDEAC